MKKQIILDQMILVVLNISLWQGRKALRIDDLAANGIDVGKLPPGTLATLGSKRVISPDAVKVFVNLKRTAMQLCLKYGVRFGGDGYAVPREKVEALSKELQRLKEEFAAAKANFISVYEQEVERWINLNPPEWAPVIRASVDSLCYVQRALSFKFSALDVKAPQEIEANGLDEELGSLYGQLCHEVRVAARRAFEISFVGRNEISQRTLRPIKSIREKLAGLLFLEPSISETIMVIDDTLAKLPAEGAITGTDLNMVAGLLGMQLANMGRQYESVAEEASDEDDGITEPVIVSPNTGKVEPISWDF